MSDSGSDYEVSDILGASMRYFNGTFWKMVAGFLCIVLLGVVGVLLLGSTAQEAPQEDFTTSIG